MDIITPADLLGGCRGRAKPRALASRSCVVTVAPPFDCTIPGDPIPKGRPRHFLAGRRIITTTPQDTRDAEAKIRAHLAAAHAPRYVGVQVHLALVFRLAHGRRVDADNLAKLVLDACNGILWDDDYQIATLNVALTRYAPEASTYLSITAGNPLWTKPKRKATP